MRAGLPAAYPRLWRFALSLTGTRDVAADLAQATCLRALDKADRFTPGTRLDSWLYKIAQRIWLNEMRSKAVRVGGGLVPVEEIEIPAPGLETETNILAREVLSLVNALPEGQRIAVLLVYVEGFSYAEAAEILEIPVGTIMSRLSTARRKVGDAVADTEVDRTR
ncbi:RNA polymerase sigma24 factor [Jannaschia pagri]|uniref:RNA polymerase sigma24 factor n=1 Tax=Jannaschia pagri TaxID=2829797 RepID=A0ABQ4NRH7_9RHOB|nr:MULTISPECIES: RNA polymerase sigma factor [unclassified Jannaschia]GIT93050.1 RNA polymerase sigma24 factor [Jannaschia sp. AI_61]GIT96885.1 RNA polymerase sigma24 factor [Jannaschia sp. AI_62]